MKRIRSRLVAACLATALLPAVPISLLVRDLVERSVSAPMARETERALESALEESRERLALEKQAFEREILAEPGTRIERLELDGERLVADVTDAAGMRRTIDRPLPEGVRERAERVTETLGMLRALERERGAVVRGYVLPFVLAYVLLLAAAAALGMILARRIARPVEALAIAARRVGAGDLETRVTVPGSGEVGALVDSFNAMVEDLAAHREERARLERLAAWRDLARKLAHEIKNPLTPIQLAVHQATDRAAARGGEDASVARECREIVDEEIDRLRRLVREFSEFARLPTPELVDADLAALLRDVARLYGEDRVTVVAAAVPLRARFDAAEMRRALVNLIDNALAACRDAGAPERVEIRASTTGRSRTHRRDGPRTGNSAGESAAHLRAQLHHQEGRDGARSRHRRRNRARARRLDPRGERRGRRRRISHLLARGRESMKRRILVVDDEKNIRRTLGMILRGEGYDVDEAETAEEGLKLLREGPALAIVDVNLPGMSGLDLLKEAKRLQPELAVIVISGEDAIARAVEATRAGAFDFLEKPLGKERVLVAVRNALQSAAIGREWRELKERESVRHVMVGDSAPMRRLREEIARAAPTTARVLILGESGTGKELVARAIHEASPRARGPFVKVNCAAIPEELIESELFGAVKGAYTGAHASRDGKFMQADGGTIFLDEIGDMSAKAQAKVLRVLQEGEIERVGGSETIRVDVRVVAATNKNLAAETSAGRFREDLWFRLNVVPIAAPALRERREDVPHLARHFLERFRLENGRPPVAFAADALDALAALPWPGNVRELANVVERLAIMAPGPEIARDDVERNAGVGGLAKDAPHDNGPAGTASPALEEVRRAGGLVEARRRFEAACIEEALRATRRNVSAAARLLSIDRTNLHKKIQSYGLIAHDHEEGDSPEETV